MKGTISLHLLGTYIFYSLEVYSAEMSSGWVADLEEFDQTYIWAKYHYPHGYIIPEGPLETVVSKGCNITSVGLTRNNGKLRVECAETIRTDSEMSDGKAVKTDNVTHTSYGPTIWRPDLGQKFSYQGEDDCVCEEIVFSSPEQSTIFSDIMFNNFLERSRAFTDGRVNLYPLAPSNQTYYTSMCTDKCSTEGTCKGYTHTDCNADGWGHIAYRSDHSFDAFYRYGLPNGPAGGGPDNWGINTTEISQHWALSNVEQRSSIESHLFDLPDGCKPCPKSTSFAEGSICPSRIPDDLFQALESKLNWVDVNAAGNFPQSCTLTVRFYPPTASIRNLTEVALFYVLPESCAVRYLGDVKKVEGFAELDGVKLSCN